MKSLFKVAIFSFPLILWGASIRQTIGVNPGEITFQTARGYDVITVPGCDYISTPGHPHLPVKSVYVLLPADAELADFRITGMKTEKIDGSFHIYPAQHQIPLLKGLTRDFTPPDEAIYKSENPYPAVPLEFVKTGNLGGYRVAAFRFYPLYYIPKRGELYLCRELDFEVDFKAGNGTKAIRRSEAAERIYRSLISHLVLNPEDIERFAPKIRDIGQLEYLIITDEAYQDAFEPLIAWKTRKGFMGAIRTVSWIDSHYSGYDLAEKIRNYLKIVHADSGVTWVLIGGDTDIVPARKAYVYAEGYTDYAPSDLYYSDLDGTWDADGDHVYGEVADSLDLFPDVYVGRAPVNSLSEAQTFVSKVLNYEKNPPLDYETDMLFMAEVLWTGCSGHVSKEIIDTSYVPDYFDITKLYEVNGNLNHANAISELNEGMAYINHSGHANYNVLSIAQSTLTPADFDGLVNDARQGLFYSIGCWSAALDRDCIAEHFVNNPDGGGIAYVGNSRYGFGDPDNPGQGTSELYDQTFFKALFDDGEYRAGVTHVASKLYYRTGAMVDGETRWCYLDLNLLGDPELPLWTNTPSTMLVNLPSTLYIGQNSLVVTVSQGAQPIENALVCAYKEGEVHETGYTNSGGQVILQVDPASLGYMKVTVTARDFLPFEDSIQVIPPEGPYVTHIAHTLDDDDIPPSSGDGDGSANPGERIEITIAVKNFGMEDAYGVSGTLSLSNPFAALIDSNVTFGDIPSGDTALSQEPCVLHIEGNCPDNEVITLSLVLEDTLGNSWESYFDVTVHSPVLAYSSYTVNDSSGGNGNGMAEPGEEFQLSVILANSGSDDAVRLTGTLSSSSPYLDIIDSTALFPYIPEGGAGASYYFSLYVDDAAPAPFSAPMHLHLVSESGFETEVDFEMSVGGAGFSDDVENGQGNWTHMAITPSYSDQWHISTTRYHSSSHSWKCGSTGSGIYTNYLDAGLITEEILLPPQAELVFWHWMDAETSSYYLGYAYDGGVVEISTDGGSTWQLITPEGGYTHHIRSGTGNPLPPETPCFSGMFNWREEHFDLSEYSGVVRFRFRFTSDQGVGREGWYVDDILVATRSAPDIDPRPLKFIFNLAPDMAETTMLRIANTGSSSLSFDITLGEGLLEKNNTHVSVLLDSPDWLSAYPLSGTVPPGCDVAVQVTANTYGLSPDDYVGRIDISSNDPDEPLITVPVFLNVTGCIPGDANGNGDVGPSDIVYLANYLYLNGSEPTPCGDVNGDCEITSSDLVYLSEYFYHGGPAPLPPCERSISGFKRRTIPVKPRGKEGGRSKR